MKKKISTPMLHLSFRIWSLNVNVLFLIICSFCREVKYLLNFKAFKFCLKGVPESVQDHIVTPFLYFKRIHGCHPFFAWSRDLSRIEIYLDNPHEPYNIKKLINFFCK